MLQLQALPTRVLSVLAVTLLGTHQRADVLVVDDDGGPGVDFTTIQEAIDAASEGDTILVKDGTYPESPNIQGKGLVLMSEQGTRPIIQLQIDGYGLDLRTIEDLPATSHVTLRGLEFRFAEPQSGESSVVYLKDCVGPVWIEDCVIGVPGDAHGYLMPALWLESCASVTVLSSEIVALDGVDEFTVIDLCDLSTQIGVSASASNLFVIDSTIEGGDGPSCTDSVRTAVGGGSDGLLATNGSLVLLQNSTVQGGAWGGCGVGGGVVAPSDAGDGVDLRGSSAIYTRGASLVGGLGGGSWACSTPDGAPLRLDSSSVSTDYPEAALSVQATSPVREGELVTLDFAGPASAPLWIAVGADPLGYFVPQLRGAVLVSPPWALLALGSLDASGSLSRTFVATPLPPGVLALELFAQGLYLDGSTGRFVLGGGTVVVGLDASF